MLYQINDGTLAAGSEIVLSHFDFQIRGGEHIAIVGANGAGKTTLLRLIAGELELERDDKRKNPGIKISRDVSIGLLKQQVYADLEHTVEEELLSGYGQTELWSRERFEYEMRYDKCFTAFGFNKEDKLKRLSEFSGGERTKIALIKLLIMQPNILLLDEPTNHLDVEAVEWLEEYLISYPGAVVVVSHDRFFLDRTAQIVYEAAGGRLTRYVGNYTQYRDSKVKAYQLNLQKYQEQQAELERLGMLVERFKTKPKKAAFARSRRKIMERMDRVEVPAEPDNHIFTGEIIPDTPGDKWVIEAQKLVFGYDRPLMELSLRIKRGQKIGIIGPNGVGKSTFLKTIAGLKAPIGGKFQIGAKTDMIYFDQLLELSEDPKVAETTILKDYLAAFPLLTQKDARDQLAKYLFRGGDVYKSINKLSGGERTRLRLAKIIGERPHLMLLDEPTNHMDIPAKETLESAFKAYKGTLLFVSHDRYFIEQVADALLIFDDGCASYYPFGYSHYLERRRRLTEISAINNTKGGAGNSSDISLVIQAEDQALLSGLQAVPKGQTLLGHELTTEQLYLDWKLRLAREAMEKKEEVVAECAKSLKEADDNYAKELLKSAHLPLEHGNDADVLYKEKLLYDQAVEEWHKACIDWYEVYIF